MAALQRQLFSLMLAGRMKGSQKKGEDGGEYDSTESSLDKRSRLPRPDAASLERKNPPVRVPAGRHLSAEGSPTSLFGGGPASRQADAALTDSLACLRGTDGSGAGLAANAEGDALSRRATCRLRCARADGTLALLLFPRAHCWTLRNR